MMNDYIDTDAINLDRRIIKESYRTHLLIARFWKDEYCGVVFQGKKKIAEYVGDHLDDIVQHLRGIVDAELNKRYQQRANKEPSITEIQLAIANIKPTMNEGEQLMLQHHCQKAKGIESLVKLAKVGGVSSTTDVMLSYAKIAQNLCDELGFTPTVSQRSQNAEITLLLEIEDLNQQIKCTDNQTSSGEPTRLTLQSKLIPMLRAVFT